MKTSGVSSISILTSFEAEEPVAALLETVFGETPSIYSSAEKTQSAVTAYSRSKSLQRFKVRLQKGLRELKSLGLDIGKGEIRIQRVKRKDWSESWKKYFKTIEIGSVLMIKPSWSKQKPRSGQAVVILDPGLSFGTGQHATTSFCLERIVALRPKYQERKKMLDMGSGSGILAISAAKLGYEKVDGFDFDPMAVKIAKKNCRSNHVEEIARITRKDLVTLPMRANRTYEVICANLISDLLISEWSKILERLAPNGTLILAGILATEFEKVRAVYEAAGLRLVKSKTEREWRSGAFSRNKPDMHGKL